ncbi:hypothetical protein NQ315_010625 [Exocentrus adspersus]|uniref:Tyr recombinase domain-containing protein n=1 Tax=Exocentrus adspersus TaxID=1586481 RepID=A0AAV8W541_9CUCU|nr:hypothetical protein NQ315_010625 [Exocentrus adspersus]
MMPKGHCEYGGYGRHLNVGHRAFSCLYEQNEEDCVIILLSSVLITVDAIFEPHESESRGYKPKKAAILERAHIEEFLTRACDKEYLMIKVALIMGISGACRCCELTNLKSTKSTDVKDAGSYLLVSIPDTKTSISRKFTIIEERFCPVGINTLATVPSIVASFLNLPNAQLYTSHCMRRTSTTLLANKGADLTTIKRHGGWKSSAVAESYIEDSISNKLDIARKVQGESNVTRYENDGNNPTRVVINRKEVACEKNWK